MLHRVFIETYGCQMNVYDSSAIYGILAEAGIPRAETLESASVVLLNTCSVRDLAEHKIISRVGELRSLTRRGFLNVEHVGVCGCMAERLGDTFLKGQSAPDLVVGVDRYRDLPAMLDKLSGERSGRSVATGHLDDVHYVAPPEAMPTNNSHLVTIHKGCDYRCTYCIVPETRGPQREKAPDVIMDEIARIIEFGGDEITLLGQNVTAYRHQDLDFADLLTKISTISGLKRIRFLTGHPRDMDEKLIRTVGGLEKVCPWLHVPAQSGSDRILRKMKRLYTCGEYLKMVEQARTWIKDVTFSGDFIVGFPGETDEDFRRTLELIREVRYDQTFNFKYSERPGTPAARLDDDVPDQLKKDRLAELLELQETIWEDMATECLGEEWTVVCEGRARRPEGAVKCRTPNNRKVLLENVSGQPGDIFRVRVTAHRLTTFVAEVIPTNER